MLPLLRLLLQPPTAGAILLPSGRRAARCVGWYPNTIAVPSQGGSQVFYTDCPTACYNAPSQHPLTDKTCENVAHMGAEYQQGDTADYFTRHQSNYLCKYRELHSLGSKPHYGRQPEVASATGAKCYGQFNHVASPAFQCLCSAAVPPPPPPDPCRRALNPCPDFEVCAETGFVRRFFNGECVSTNGKKFCIYYTANTRQPCADRAGSMDAGARVHRVKDVGGGADKDVLAVLEAAGASRAVIVQTGGPESKDVVQLVPTPPKPGAVSMAGAGRAARGPAARLKRRS